MKLPALVAATMVVATAANAAASSRVISNFAGHFAFLIYAEDRCPQLRMNLVMLSDAAASLGIPKEAMDDDGAVVVEGRAAMKEHVSSFRSLSDRDFCGMAEDTYGPSGTFAPGFLKRR